MKHSAGKLFALVITLLCVITAMTFAQTQYGTVTGRAVDPSGAVVPEATAILTNNDTGEKVTVMTGDQGTYTFAGVKPGNYTLTVEKQGFSKYQERFPVLVAQRVTRDASLRVGSDVTAVEVVTGAEVINTTTAEVATTITAKQLENLPLPTKNPYALIGIAGGAVDTASTNGDTRGTGYAVNGQRSASINYMLDGVENNETFATGPGTIVPNDSVQEFKVQANNMTAEFGRNAIVTNVVTKSGTNAFHGSASNFYRGAAFTANTVNNKANDIPKPNFVRNDFTGTFGGPIFRDRTFFFMALEGVRVRSSGNNSWYVPTQEFFNSTSAGMQAVINAGGGLPNITNPGDCVTAGAFRTDNSTDVNGDGMIDASELIPQFNTAGGVPIADSTNLFCKTITSAPVDAGGGTAQNTWNGLAKVDHRFSDRTNMSFRYAITDQRFPTGAVSDTPYTPYQTGGFTASMNSALTVTHSFSNTLVMENRLSFSRTNLDAPLGAGDETVPCVFFGNLNGSGSGDPIVFPGYLPSGCTFVGLPSGGPQNTLTANTGWTLSKGRQTIKFGVYGSHLRDNHTFGAFSQGAAVIGDPQNLINGIVDQAISVAIDPKGVNAGGNYDPTLLGPFQAPNFTRHYRYNEVALYAEDSIRLTNRLTANLGLRWEYFGVLHSPHKERFLDANFYLDAVGQPAALNPSKTVFEQIRDGRFSRTNNFFNQDWNNFGPRVGFAYDVFGTGKTSIRAGYGIFYDKNFGNALYNTIQNFPNYAVLTPINGVAGAVAAPVTANQYDVAFNMLGGGNPRLSGSARMLDREMVTAYSQQWNASLEHDLFGKGIITQVTYVGTKGDKLYSLNNLNMLGTCIFVDPSTLPPPSTCTSTGRVNQSGVSGLNRRSNEAFSRYHGVTGEVRTRSIRGLTLQTNYTYSRSKDNTSSFFGDSTFEGQFGFGFRDPFNPALDYADSANDIRHRYLLSYNWDVPIGNNLTGVAKTLLGGWSLSGIYNVQSGGTFSVYDSAGFDSVCSRSGTNFCYPLNGTVPDREQTLDPSSPNTYTLYDLSGLTRLSAFCEAQTGVPANDPLTGAFNAANQACTRDFYLLNPEGLLGRNLFRLPGFWNFDAALAKNFQIGERIGIRLSAEAFNIFNHSNLYGNPGTNDASAGTVQANYGLRPVLQGTAPASGVIADRRNLQLGARITF